MTDLQTMAETSLYDDHSYSGSMSGESSQNSPSESSGGQQLKRPTAISLTNSSSNIKDLKKNLTLDFTSPESAKKTLGTPDIVRFLQLASPELEKFITQGVVQVTTPTPTNFLFPKDVTSEQEQYARGFIDALNHIHQSNNFSPGANLLSPAGIAATLAANTAAVQAAAAASKNNFVSASSSSQDSAVTSSTSSSGGSLNLKGVQSPIKPGTSLPSVIMSTVGFPVSMSSLNNFTHSYNAMNSLLGTGGIPGPGTIPAAMALFNIQNSRAEQKPTPTAALLQEDRPPSQSAEPGSMEFTNLTQAQTLAAPAPSGLVTGGTFQLQANQYLNVSSSSTANHMPHSSSRVRPGSSGGSAIIVKQEPDQAVPNVNIQVDGSFGMQSSSSTVPLDLKEQEALKLERKRHRNRIAATKCRKRKLEKIADLEDEVKAQEVLKKDLVEDSMNLKGEISRLRAEMEVHRNNGCSLSKLLNGIAK